jgi:hypothetical protein
MQLLYERLSGIASVSGRRGNADMCIYVGILKGNSRQIAVRIGNRRAAVMIVNRSYQ